MANTKTSAENERTTVTGLEEVRLAYAGANYKKQLDEFVRVKFETDRTFYVSYLTGTIVGGSSYTNGLYEDVPLTGGAGSGARANIRVAGNAVTMVQISDRTSTPSGYAVTNVLSALDANLGGGGGSGFTFTITAIGSNTTGDGSSATPWQTPQFAWDTIQEIYDFAGFNCTIQLEDAKWWGQPDGSSAGTMADRGAVLAMGAWIGHGTLTWVGRLNETGGLPSVAISSSNNDFINACVDVDESVEADIVTWDSIAFDTSESYTCLKFDGGQHTLQSVAFGPDFAHDPCFQGVLSPGKTTVNGTIWFLISPVTICNGGNFDISFGSTLSAVAGVTMVGNPFFGIGSLGAATGPGVGQANGVTYDGDWDEANSRSITVGPDGNFLDLFTSGSGGVQVPGAAHEVWPGGNLLVWDFTTSQAFYTGTQGSVDRLYQFETPSTGGTVTVSPGKSTVIIAPSGTLATLTINMPSKITGTAGKPDGSKITFFFKETLTALTLVAGDSDTLINAPSTVAVGTHLHAIYRAANTSWYFGA